MTNKIVAVQGNNPLKLNPITDTSVFLAHEIQNKKYREVGCMIVQILKVSPSELISGAKGGVLA